MLERALRTGKLLFGIARQLGIILKVATSPCRLRVCIGYLKSDLRCKCAELVVVLEKVMTIGLLVPLAVGKSPGLAAIEKGLLSGLMLYQFPWI